MIADGNIEIYRHKLAILYPFFQKYDNSDELANPDDIEVSQAVSTHANHAEAAFRVLKEQIPELYQELITTNRALCIFSNPDVFCFASIGVHSCAFLSTIPTNGIVFFVEELIHQCAHNAFNAMLFDRDTYFKIDIEKAMLGDLIGQELEARTIFSAYHGLYTVVKRLSAFRKLYDNCAFDGVYQHEFLGRLFDMEKRFKTGLELLNFDSVYTSQGKWVYDILNAEGEYVINSLANVRRNCNFDFSNQPLEFSYASFLALNPLEDFLSRNTTLVLV